MSIAADDLDPEEAERDAQRRKTMGRHAGYFEGEARRKAMLEAVASGLSIKDAIAQVGVSMSAYRKWRDRYKPWAAQLDAVRVSSHHPTASEEAKGKVRKAYDVAKERKEWFGHDTPPFQMEVLEALRDLPPGNILMVLFPPEHGKTTMFEDDVSLDIAHNPWLLTHVASETQALSAKILNKIRNRLDPDPANRRMVEFVNRYGPFAPQTGGRKTTQPWASTHFDVYGKGSFDDRDYTMAALGFGSQIIGSRSHRLHGDDLQSMKSLGRTEKMMDEFQQDWLSRPGETGSTSIFGNRVDVGDIYEAMEETFDPDILRIVRYPAIIERPDGSIEPLWPERWSLEQLDRMKRKLRGRTGSDERWERNWMQRPRSKLFLTFTQPMLDLVKNSQVSLNHPKPSEGKLCYLTLDPAIDGRTAIMVLQMTDAGRIRPVYIRDLPGLRTNEAIMSECRSALLWAQAHGFTVISWVIEAMAFQKGLARDERLLEYGKEFGVPVVEHMTGWNKYDENAGVPSMVTTFVKGEIELPWAPDDETRSLVGELERQLLKWRPGKKGNVLRQDLVMALWFGWIRWRMTGKRPEDRDTSSQFRTAGLPYAKADSGLILPVGYVPTILGSSR